MLAKYIVGASHYPYMILLHVSFFVCLLIEVIYFKSTGALNYNLFVLFLLLQLKVWCLISLDLSNTKIIILDCGSINEGSIFIYATSEL